MSIQLFVCSPRELFEDLIRPQNAAERKRNFACFVQSLRSETRSAAIDFNRRRLDGYLGYDVLVSEALLAQDITREHCPDYVFVTQSDLYVPCNDPEERFHFQFHFVCNGEDVTWRITDVGSLREWIASLRNNRRRGPEYDPETLSAILKKHELAANMAEEHHGLLLFSY